MCWKDRNRYGYSLCAIPQRELDIILLFSWLNVPVDCARGRGTQTIRLQITPMDTSVTAAADNADADREIPLYWFPLRQPEVQSKDNAMDIDMMGRGALTPRLGH